MEVVLVDAYCKQNGQQILNTQFRGIVKPSLKNFALQHDFDKYLKGEIKQEEIERLSDAPHDRHYRGDFDVLNNCFVVRNCYYRGLVFYVFSNTLVWGVFYDGDGIAW